MLIRNGRDGELISENGNIYGKNQRQQNVNRTKTLIFFEEFQFVDETCMHNPIGCFTQVRTRLSRFSVNFLPPLMVAQRNNSFVNAIKNPTSRTSDSLVLVPDQKLMNEF